MIGGQCLFLFHRDERGLTYTQPGIGNAEAVLSFTLFCKEALLFGKGNLLFNFPCPSIIMGKCAEILKKALGNVFISASLGSYKNKQITEPTRETIVKSLHLSISKISSWIIKL